MLTRIHEGQGGISQITKTKTPSSYLPALACHAFSLLFCPRQPTGHTRYPLASPAGVGDTDHVFVYSVPLCLSVHAVVDLLFSSYMECEYCGVRSSPLPLHLRGFSSATDVFNTAALSKPGQVQVKFVDG